MTQQAPPPAPAEHGGGGAPSAAAGARRSFSKRSGDLFLGLAARGSAITVLLMLGSLIAVLAAAAIPSARTFGPGFLVSSDWRPNELEVPRRSPEGKVIIEDGEVVTDKVPPSFGALPVIYGTAVSSLLALTLAVPLSLGAALFIVRIAPRYKVAGAVSFLVEFLAAIPSIAYGIWGLFVLAPLMQNHIEPGIRSVLQHIPGLQWLFFDHGNAVALTGKDMFTSSIVLAIMILPIITAVSRDVLKAVPRAQIEGTQALGATWWQSSRGMLSYARSGLFGAVMLGLARAAGETMAITMVIGNNNQIKASPFAPAQTMSSLLANEFAEADPGLHRSALLQVALILLLMSLVFNVIARWLVVGSSSHTSAAH